MYNRRRGRGISPRSKSRASSARASARRQLACQHSHQRTADLHLALGRAEQVGAQALVAVLRRDAQPTQTRRGNPQRPQLHRPMRQMHVGDDPTLAPQQQAIEWLVERVFQRGVKLRPRRALENGLQEVVDRRVVAACRPEHRQPHAALGGSLRNQIRRRRRNGLLAHRKRILSTDTDAYQTIFTPFCEVAPQ